MDKKNAKKNTPPALNDMQFKFIKQLKEYEQNIIQYLRSQTNTLQTIEETIKDKTDKLKTLESSLTKQYAHIELVEVYKTNLQKGMNSLQVLCEDINQGNHDTLTTLIKIANLSTAAENTIKEKQAKNKKELNVLDKNCNTIEDESLLLELSEADEQNEWDVTFAEVKNNIANEDGFIKSEENEIIGLIDEENEENIQLTIFESDLNEYEQSIIHFNLEIEKVDVENLDLEENMKQCKIEVDDIKLKLDECIEMELNVKNYLQKVKSEISAFEDEHSKLKEHEIFQLLIDEENVHQFKVKEFEEHKNELMENCSLLDSDIIKERTMADQLNGENFQLEIDIQKDTETLTKINDQIETIKNKDTSQPIIQCKQESKSTFDKILIINTEINEFKRQVADLEQKIITIPTVSDDDISLVNQEIANLKIEVEDKVVQMEEEYKEFINELNGLKEDRKKEMVEKIEKLQELVKEINVKIAEVVITEKTANITFQANLVECDVFAKKLKDKMETRHNLKKQIKNFKKPVIPERRRRGIDELSDASDTAYNSFTNIQDIQKYMMAKNAKRHKRN